MPLLTPFVCSSFLSQVSSCLHSLSWVKNRFECLNFQWMNDTHEKFCLLDSRDTLLQPSSFDSSWTILVQNKSSVSKRTSKETNNNSHETSSPWNSLTSSSSSSSREDLEADREEDSLHVTHCRRNNVIKEDPHLDKSASTTKVLMSKMSRKENLFLSRKAASFSHEIVEKTVNSNHG